MPEIKLANPKLSSKIKDISDDLPRIIQFVEKKVKEGDIETQIDIKALVDKIRYATYGAEPLSLIYALSKYIHEFKDEALHIMEKEEQ